MARKVRQVGREEARQKYKTRWWERATDREIVEFQLYQTRSTMPFPDFHMALQRVLDRTVWNIEYMDIDAIRDEFEGTRPKPTPDEIMAQFMGRVPMPELDDEG